MRELLIRYLLGELNADERRDVQSRLQSSPELQRELAQLRECFAAHQDEDFMAAGPPRGLAERTAERVAGCDDASELAAERPEVEFSATSDPPAGILGWNLADLTVAGGVMLAVSMLLFPALRNSRDGTRRVVCQNNLGQLLQLGARYADTNHGVFPEVGQNENAGIFVARLISHGTAIPEELAVLLICPASPIADKIRSGAVVLQLPRAAAIQAMSAGQLAQVTAMASPAYAYRFGYFVGHKYQYLHDERQSLSPVFCDSPGDESDHTMSRNHGSKIVQVAFADGSVKSLTSSKLPGGDDLYHNDFGMVAAGTSQQDAVLAPSDALPGIELPDRAR